MEEVTEAQRGIYTLLKSPQPGSSRAVVEDVFLRLNVLFFFSYTKVAGDDQVLVMQLRCQVLLDPRLGVG